VEEIIRLWFSGKDSAPRRPSGTLPCKKYFWYRKGIEKVKIWMFYQPLTSIGPAAGKEK
jgi:hypothetical protein